jgi:hypothetical protein
MNLQVRGLEHAKQMRSEEPGRTGQQEPVSAQGREPGRGGVRSSTLSFATGALANRAHWEFSSIRGHEPVHKGANRLAPARQATHVSPTAAVPRFRVSLPRAGTDAVPALSEPAPTEAHP